MNPEAEEAIRIAEKHLVGEPAARRNALALDIVAAIIRHAEVIALEAINEAARGKRH